MSEWKIIPLFEKYMVSSKWEVKSLNYHREWYEKMLIPRLDKRAWKWYYYLSLMRNDNVYTRRIHHLVMLAFVWERPEKYVVNHKNGIKTDNRVENLEYCTIWENNLHAFRVLWRKPNKTNLWKLWILSPLSKPVWQYDLKDNLIKMYPWQWEASRITWVRQWDISSCVTWKQKTAWGFKWK